MRWSLHSLRRAATTYRPCLALIALALWACAEGAVPEGAPSTSADALQPARVTAEEFGRLRWLEGRWRGAEGAGAPFFESYRFVDDSTIQQYSYADSTFAAVSDSGLIRFRGDTVTGGWPVPRYVATAVSADSVHFAALPGAANDFTWRSGGHGRWTARLTWDSAGVARERIYEMRAIP